MREDGDKLYVEPMDHPANQPLQSDSSTCEYLKNK